MEVTSFFSRLLRPPTLSRRESEPPHVQLDDVEAFESAWTVIQAVLLEPDERQLLRGIHSTVVPAQLSWIVQALVYEHEEGEHGAPTGGCLEYFLNEGMLRHLVELSDEDRPFGVRAEVLKSINHLVLLLPDSFLIHASVHRPLLQLIRSSIDAGEQGAAAVNRTPGVGAAVADERDVGGHARADNEVEKEGRLVDLLSIVCAKLRASPLLLLILFHDRVSSANPASGRLSMPRSTSSRSLGQEHLDYLIFSFLLRYVHYDGGLGECARLGSECLLDIALGAADLDLAGAQGGEMSAQGDDALQRAKRSLAEQIVEVDSADVLAAGLGAVYSVLPFKIRLPAVHNASHAEEGGMHLGDGADDTLDRGDTGLQTIRDCSVEEQLKMLLKVWTFINGVMVRCQRASDGETMADEATRSIADRVGQQIRRSIRLSFLDNVLYPSILECSTTDGSAVAVLSYLRVILRLDDTLEAKEPLSQFILAYLLGFDVSEADEGGPSSKTCVSLTTRFTLKDLLMDAIGSSSTEAGTAALGLLSGLLEGHCRASSTGLLASEQGQGLTAFARDIPIAGKGETIGLAGAEVSVAGPGGEEEISLPIKQMAAAFSSPPDRTIEQSPLDLDALKLTAATHPDVNLYVALLGQIDRQALGNVQASWDAYVKDSYASLSRHNCFKAGLSGRASPGDLQLATDGPQAGHTDSWTLRPGDKVLREMLTMLRHLFSHTARFNVALTAALSSLAVCPRCSLSGWSTRVLAPRSEEPETSANGFHGPGQVSEEDPFKADGEDRLPILFITLRELTKQIAIYRSRVTGFDRYLAERRQGLLYIEGMQDAMNVMLDVVPTQTSSPEWTPQRAANVNLATDASPRPSRGLSSSLLSFLTPRKKSSHAASSSISNSPFSFLAEEQDGSSPHAAHYQKTSSVTLDPLTAPEPLRSTWTPEKPASAAASGQHSRTISESETTSDDLFAQTRTVFNPNLPKAPAKVSLSAILDNCVILEEFIKETLGQIVARQTLGIDEV